MTQLKLRAKDYPKLHSADPSGFWHLIRTGEKLPQIGERILYVHDIRGTSAELQHNLFVRIANGNPYKCSGLQEKVDAGKKIYEHEVMIAELLKLPVTEYKPETRIGVVDGVVFDKVMQEWYITVEASRGWPGFNVDPDHIIYWAPFPTPPDTYVERPDNPEILDFRSQQIREVRVQDYLETRARRRTE